MSLILPIDEVLLIVKTKFADPAIVLLSFSKKKSCKSLSWQKLPIDQIAI